MEDIGVIHIDRGRLFEIRLSELEQWLPGMYALVHLNKFDARGVVRQRTSIFDGQVYHTVTSETIVMALEELVTDLQSRSLVASSTGKNLQRSIEVRLKKDLSVANTVGLRRSREQFMVFCLLTLLTRSQALAESMANFIQRFIWEIVYGEGPELFREWCMGIVALQDLVPRQILEELLRCFPGFGSRPYKPSVQLAYHDLCTEMITRYMMQARHYPLLNRQRVRGPLMLEDRAEYLRDPSLPVHRARGHHRGHRQLRITYPWAQPYDYVDEIGKIQYQQEEMNIKTDHIDRKLDYLF